MNSLYQFKNILTNNITNIFLLNSISVNNKNSFNVLEPLTTLLKLCLLKYNKEGTKLSIKNNKLELLKPNIIQGYIRWEKGDNRNDLHNLYIPLIKIIKWNYFKDGDSQDKYIDTLLNIGIEGLSKLKKTYNENSIIQYTIDHFISILKKEKIEFNVSSQLNNTYEELYNVMKNMWTKRQVRIVYNLIKEIDESDESEDESQSKIFMEALYIILNDKENKIKNLLKK